MLLIYYIESMDPSTMSLDSLHQQLQELQSHIGSLFPMMRGSVVRIGTKIKKPTYSLNMNGKTRIVHLGKEREPVAKAWIENFRKLLRIVDEMTLINIELIRRIELPTKPRNSKKK